MPYTPKLPKPPNTCWNNKGTVYLHYIQPHGCDLCTRRPLSSSEVKPEYIKPVPESNPPYSTFAGWSGIDIQYIDDAFNLGYDYMGGAESGDVWRSIPFHSGTPQFLVDKWELRPGIPCVCWGSAQGLGTAGANGECESTIWEMSSLDCRRTKGGVVVPELHCSDGGMSFNAGIFNPLPNDVLQPSPQVSPPVVVPVVTATPVISTAPSTDGNTGGILPPSAPTTSVPSNIPRVPVEGGAGVIGIGGEGVIVTATGGSTPAPTDLKNPPNGEPAPGSAVSNGATAGSPLPQPLSPSTLFQPPLASSTPPESRPTPPSGSGANSGCGAYKRVNSFIMAGFVMWGLSCLAAAQ